jgi:hypothetical protein
MNIVHPSTLPPGTVISVPVATAIGDVEHYGFITHEMGPDGCPLVISKSKRRNGVVVEPFAAFEDGRRVTVRGRWGNRRWDQVLQAAYNRRGERWSATANCEHFVRECCGLQSTSPQLANHVAGTIAVVALSVVAAAGLSAARA